MFQHPEDKTILLVLLGLVDIVVEQLKQDIGNMAIMEALGYQHQQMFKLHPLVIIHQVQVILKAILTKMQHPLICYTKIL